jgi:hypothetical protein
MTKVWSLLRNNNAIKEEQAHATNSAAVAGAEKVSLLLAAGEKAPAAEV